MRFYYENNMGDSGKFSEKDLIKAIYTAWNIDATLYLIDKDKSNKKIQQMKLVFSPLDDNELNNELLEGHGYYMEDGEVEREIKKISTGEIIKYDWSEVKRLV